MAVATLGVLQMPKSRQIRLRTRRVLLHGLLKLSGGQVRGGSETVLKAQGTAQVECTLWPLPRLTALASKTAT